MNRIRFSADREFLANYITDYCIENKVRFVTRAKSNTVFYDGDFKFNYKISLSYLFS